VLNVVAAGGLAGRAVVRAALIALEGVVTYQISVYSYALVVTSGRRHEI
jgi:hypothetical protein